MKINRMGSNGINPYKRQTNNLENYNKQGKASADKLEISAAAKEMQQISQYSAARQEKVEEIKLKVENGTYKINPQDVAKSMVNYFINDKK